MTQLEIGRPPRRAVPLTPPPRMTWLQSAFPSRTTQSVVPAVGGDPDAGGLDLRHQLGACWLRRWSHWSFWPCSNPDPPLRLPQPLALPLPHRPVLALHYAVAGAQRRFAHRRAAAICHPRGAGDDAADRLAGGRCARRQMPSRWACGCCSPMSFAHGFSASGGGARLDYGRMLRKSHMLHHFHNEKGDFGVTSPVFDLVFGTCTAVRPPWSAARRAPILLGCTGGGPPLPVHRQYRGRADAPLMPSPRQRSGGPRTAAVLEVERCFCVRRRVLRRRSEQQKACMRRSLRSKCPRPLPASALRSASAHWPCRASVGGSRTTASTRPAPWTDWGEASDLSATVIAT